MSTDRHMHHAALLAPLRAARYDFEAAPVRSALAGALVPDATVRLPHPFADMTSVDNKARIGFSPETGRTLQ